MALNFQQKLFYFFPVLFCFCLPFGHFLLALLIFLWFLTSLTIIRKKAFLEGFKKPEYWLPTSFFLLTVVSAIMSKNGKEGAFSIEVKLSMLAMPWLLVLFDYPPAIVRRCVISFVSGCFFACLYLIIRAGIYAFNGLTEYFFYTLFSDFIHAAYFSMYLVLASVLIIVFYNDWFRSQRAIIRSSWLFLTVFFISVLLCSSKIGIATMFMAIPVALYHKHGDFMTPRRWIMGISAFLMVLIIAIFLFPNTAARFQSLVRFSDSAPDKTSIESTTVRRLIWPQGVQLFLDHPLMGTGVGDANDHLYESYRVNGITGAYEHKFNAHNQYIQTAIGMGLPGLILLLGMTIGTLITAIMRKNFLLAVFSFLISVNFLVESMLQTSAGVIFFSFFYCYLARFGRNELVVAEGSDQYAA